MDGKAPGGQSGGVHISGSVGSIGTVVGRDMLVNAAPAEYDAALGPVAQAVRAAPPDRRAAAETKLAALTQEAVKGTDADDRKVATLLEGLVGLVPGAVSAVVSAFATPILGGIAGPVTQYVLGKLRNE